MTALRSRRRALCRLVVPLLMVAAGVPTSACGGSRDDSARLDAEPCSGPVRGRAGEQTPSA